MNKCDYQLRPCPSTYALALYTIQPFFWNNSGLISDKQ